MPAGGNDHVVRLQVPVDHLRLMGLRQSLGDLGGNSQGILDRQRASVYEGAQRLPLDQFHRDEDSTSRLADFVDGCDVGMRDRGGRARLAQEPKPPLLVTHHLRRQDLQGHQTAQILVFGLVNHAHSTFADFLQDAEVGEGLADQGRPFKVSRLDAPRHAPCRPILPEISGRSLLAPERDGGRTDRRRASGLRGAEALMISGSPGTTRTSNPPVNTRGIP